MNTERDMLRTLLEGCGSRFALVTFVKKDATVRQMLIQHAATKFRVKGESASEQAQRAAKTRAENYPNLFNTYDVDRREIRSINLDTVLHVKSGRDLYVADDNRVVEIIDKVLKEVA